MTHTKRTTEAETAPTLRKPILPTTTSGEEPRPLLLCETPPIEKTNLSTLKCATELVEQLEEFRRVKDDFLLFFDGTKKELLELQRRYELLQHLIFGSEDYCAPGVFEKEIEDVRSIVMELGECDEATELLKRLDEIAEDMADD